ncbi:Alpha-mannosidase [Hondaea fermentalgiana]|uniref:Alpha-mannosidase n=1 Tax=Hondaea fermentalgiana TaxID=2315210 RepID=A0A2R5GP04_9STRA|nr:Alpha-mannosidase [Hondaea fermentalgiana]|eukprot:GBG31498.1 Alpha-mannosidase [Hondaea fermentalgiana]
MMQLRPLLLLFLCSLIASPVVARAGGGQEPSTSDDHDDKIQVHVISHTHDDTGWLLTVDQYFEEEVRYILNTVVDNLERNPARKFNYVEMAFFSRWWDEQTPVRRDAVRRLVKEKRLQFLNGGWCMHDEAGPLALEMIDQTTRGHQFILAEFGPHAAPSVTWQVDPFGHTNTQAWLLAAEAGMPAMFWARMNFEDRELRKTERELEYIWRGSKSNGANTQILGGELWGSKGSGLYGCPFTFEEYHQAAAMVANKARHDYNMDDWVERAVAVALEQAKNFKTKNILWACGFDFAYKNAATWYESLDKLMAFVNADGRINMFYSTPADYVQALSEDKNATWNVREDDLMPLHEHPHVYWTGYFSSRVALKRLLRKSSSLLQTARQLAFAASLRHVPVSQPRHGPRVGTSWTDAFEAAVAVAMHHDGISGTAKQAVADDYAQRIAEGRDELDRGMVSSLRILTNVSGLEVCPALNVSLCATTAGVEHQNFTLVAWNPLSSAQPNHIFAVPVRIHSGDYVATAVASGTHLPTQLIPLDDATKKLPELYLNEYGLSASEAQDMRTQLRNQATHVLHIQADIPPMQATVIKVIHTANTVSETSQPVGVRVQSQEWPWDKPLRVETDMFRLDFDRNTQALRHITNKDSGVEADFTLDWGYYESAAGPCAETGCAKGAVSGAYLFRPESSTLHSLRGAKDDRDTDNGTRPSRIKTQVVRGDLVTEVRQEISPWVTHVIRLRQGAPYIEVEYNVGPIPIDDKKGKEVVIRYSSDLRSESAFATDSNGLELQPRIRNRLPSSYPEPRMVEDEPVAGNYYPVNSMISLTEPERAQLTVITDSTQGGSSLSDGQVELMVHRRVLHDDNKGVVEPLNETMCGCNGAEDATCYCAGLAIRGVHRVVFDTPFNANATRRVAADRLHFAPEAFFSKDVQSDGAVRDGSPVLSSDIPPSIRVLSVIDNYEQTLGANTVLVRLQHIYSVDEHDELSKPVTVQLRSLFPGRQVLDAHETSLTGNMRVEDKPSFHWQIANDSSHTPPRQPLNRDSSELDVEIGPMQIRTFAIKLQPLAAHSSRPAAVQ